VLIGAARVLGEDFEMAFHEKDKIKDSLLDDMYASSDLSVGP